MHFNFIPTDNLYKFLAISGLFLIVFNFYYSGEEVYKIEEEQIKQIYQMKKLRPLYGAVQAKVDQSRKMLSEIGQLLIENTAAHEKYQDAYDEFELRNTRKSGELAILLYDSIAMRRNVIDSLSARQRMFDRQLSKLNLQLDSASSVIDLNNELLEMKVKKYKYFTNLLEYGSLLSAIMASVGFSNWYRIQQKMDQQLFKRVPNKNSPFYRKRRSKK